MGLLMLSVAPVGCQARPEPDVVLHSTLDEEIAAPILAAFERSTDHAIGVISRFDAPPHHGRSELMSQILLGRDRPRCDVVWNGDVLETVRLQQQGLLQRRAWLTDAIWPVGMMASDGSWCGFAATARVLIVNTSQIDDPDDYPRSVNDLGDERWSGRCAVALPRGGKSATHFAVLRRLLGEEATLQLLQRVESQAVVLRDERQVAAAVAAGQVAWGLTDSDAAVVALDIRPDVKIVYPDQASSQPGALRIPNAVAVLRRAQHPNAAGMLADYLVAPATEDRLAMGRGSQLPLSRQATFPPRALGGEAVRWMQPDFEAAGEGLDAWQAKVQEIFTSTGGD